MSFWNRTITQRLMASRPPGVFYDLGQPNIKHEELGNHITSNTNFHSCFFIKICINYSRIKAAEIKTPTSKAMDKQYPMMSRTPKPAMARMVRAQNG